MLYRFILLAVFFASPVNASHKTIRHDTIKQANALFDNYDKDITNLQKSIDMYDRITKESSSSHELYTAYYKTAMTYLIMGDFANLTHTDAINDYEKGAAAAKKAIAINPNGSEGYFWYAGNIGKIARKKNFLEALDILPKFLFYLSKSYKLNPKSTFVLEAYSELYYELPWAFGGSSSKSIEYAKRALKIDPNYTMPLTTMAKVYIKQGKYNDAKKVLEEVLNSKNPSYRAGWVMTDKPYAQKLLYSITGKTQF